MRIFLEFRHANGAIAANGTDVTTTLDGRWNAASRAAEIYRKLEELRSGPFAAKYRGQHFVGFTYAGRSDYRSDRPDATMSDPNPPSWV